MKIPYYLSLGLAIGAVSGVLGIGGGVLLIPALVWLFDMKQAQAAGISLAVLAVPVTLPSAYQYFDQGVINGDHLKIAAWIACGFAIGSFLGAGVHGHVPESVLRVGFGLVMIYIAVRFMFTSHRESAIAAAGLSSMAIALVAYWCMRVLGRRHLARPDLSQHMRSAQEHGQGDIEYHI